jgi:hypothetical protein
MSRSSVHVIVPESPIYVDAFEARTDYVGLGQPSECPEYRVFISLAPPTAEQAMMFHVSIEEARFLRSAIDTVLDQHDAITRGTN